MQLPYEKLNICLVFFSKNEGKDVTETLLCPVTCQVFLNASLVGGILRNELTGMNGGPSPAADDDEIGWSRRKLIYADRFPIKSSVGITGMVWFSIKSLASLFEAFLIVDMKKDLFGDLF